MDGRTYVGKISLFYRNSSPIGAAALPAPMKTKEKVEQGKGTAAHLMPLGYLSSLNPPYPWHGAIYQPSGTLGFPIGAPKQQYLPQKSLAAVQEVVVQLAVSRDYYCSLPSWKAAKDNRLVLVNIAIWGL